MLKYKWFIALAVACVCVNFIERTNHALLLLTFGVATMAYFKTLGGNLDPLWGLIPRILMVFSIPNLSDDFWRFIFDGQLLINAIDPYAVLPADFVKSEVHALIFKSDEVFQHLNSKNYYSVYTPLNQAVFGISAFLSAESIYVNIILLKLFILAAECGTIYILKLNFGLKKTALYAFNPLIIIELTGNCHFEALQIFFIVLAISYISKKPKASVASIFLAAHAKLNPALVIPFLLIKQKTTLLFAFIGFIISLIVAYVCFDLNSLGHFYSSFKLYFNRFEFNGLVYTLLRDAGQAVLGYNPIETLGPVLAIFTCLFWLYGVFKTFKCPEKYLQWASLSFCCYLVLSTTVHPWYIGTVLLLSILANQRFGIVWSISVFLSYTAYGTTEVVLSPYVLWLSYLPVFYFLYLDYTALSISAAFDTEEKQGL